MLIYGAFGRFLKYIKKQIVDFKIRLCSVYLQNNRLACGRQKFDVAKYCIFMARRATNVIIGVKSVKDGN